MRERIAFKVASMILKQVTQWCILKSLGRVMTRARQVPQTMSLQMPQKVTQGSDAVSLTSL